MSKTAKTQACKKLDTVRIKAGCPDKWRDYNKLDLARRPYVLNVLAAAGRCPGSTAPYLGIGSTTVAFSFSETSPSLPSIRYLILSCLMVPGAGSPPKLSL